MSGTVDASIARSILPLPAPTNPLAQAGQMIGTANALTQGRQMQENLAAMQARRHAGEAFQQSVDPTTGLMDPGKAGRLIAANPMAAYAAPEALAAAQAQQAAQLTTQAAQAQLGMTRMNNLRQTLGGLLARPNASRQQVVEAVSGLLALPENERPFSASMAATALASLPTNPSELRGWLQQQMASTDAGMQNLQQFLPRPTAINTGGEVRFTDTNPMTNQNATTQSMPMTPTPSERNELVRVWDQKTQSYVMVPRDQATPMANGSGGRPGGNGGPLGTGRYPGGQQSGAATPAPGATPGATPATPPAAPSVLSAGPSLGAPEAAAVTAQAGATSGVQLSSQADAVPSMRANLQNMRDALRNFTSGPGANWTSVASALANRWIPTPFGIKPEGVSSQEEFNKLAYQLAQQQFATLGGTGTDQQLGSAMNTSPNSALSNMGNEKIISLLMGNNDAIEAKNRAWQRWLSQGNNPGTYSQFTADFNRNYDPRVFQSVHMSREDVRKMYQGMSATERQAYLRSWRHAADQGWVTVPQAPAQGAPANGR